MISYTIKPCLTRLGACPIRASGRVATRAGKTPTKGVVPERGAERMSARSHRVGSGRLPRLESCKVMRARWGILSHPLHTNISIACIVRGLISGSMRVARGVKHKYFDERSEFHLKGTTSIFPIRFLVFVFDPKIKTSTSSRLLHLPIKFSPNIA